MMKLFLISVLACGVFFSSFSYAEIVCQKSPTLECVKNIIDVYGFENIRTGLPGQTSHYEHKELLKEQYKIIINNPSAGIDRKVIDRHFASDTEKAKFLRLLALKVIQNSKYGAPYPFWDGGSKTLTKFLNESSFRDFEPPSSFGELLDDWTATATLLESDRNDHLLQIANIWLILKNEKKTNAVLSELRDQLGVRTLLAINLLRNAKEMGLNLKIESSLFPSLPRAEILILQDQSEEAYQLLTNKKNQILLDLNSEKHETMPREQLEKLKKISLHLAQIGKNAEALVTLDQVYELTKEDAIKRNFINYAEFSKLYRMIGEHEKAESLMNEYMQRTDNRTCSSFHRPWDHAICATELVYLGHNDVAYKKAFKACRNNTNCGPIIDMYQAALETNVEPPALSDMLDSVANENQTDMLLKLSAFHFSNSDFKTGNALLEKAIITMQKNNQFGLACKLGYLSLAADRQDLLNPLFTTSITSIFQSEINLETQMRALYKTYECFESIIG